MKSYFVSWLKQEEQLSCSSPRCVLMSRMPHMPMLTTSCCVQGRDHPALCRGSPNVSPPPPLRASSWHSNCTALRIASSHGQGTS